MFKFSLVLASQVSSEVVALYSGSEIGCPCYKSVTTRGTAIE